MASRVEEIEKEREETKRRLAAQAHEQYSAAVSGGQVSYDEASMETLRTAGGLPPPPTPMPLDPEMTRSATRQATARRRQRRGRSSTMLTSTLGEETLGA